MRLGVIARHQSVVPNSDLTAAAGLLIAGQCAPFVTANSDSHVGRSTCSRLHLQPVSPMPTPLATFLSNLQSGPVADPRAVERLLVLEWDSFQGSGAGGMRASKLRGRTEEMYWRDPNLTFSIERHGGTVNGSTRAELQDWTINISWRTAEVVSLRRRQLRPTAKRLNVLPIAEEVADVIISGRESEIVQRLPDGRVKVRIGSLIGGGFEQTIAARRKRFRIALEKLLTSRGWRNVSVNTYANVAPQ